ncbi:MAG: sigma-70 family RNA polymerase sigma factor [Deltaproteobacteria bacterium]|nr:sigma-70 family RNA polymerase sigma factor [Deltaproteobacteria bacterium]
MRETTEVFCGGRPLPFSLNRKKALKAEFEKAALPHLSHLYTAAYYLIKDKSEAEDLVQETYLRAFRFFHKFRPGTNCRAWLLSIFRNLFINRYREKQREPGLVDWEKIDRAYESMVTRHEGAGENNPESLFFSRLMDHEVEQALKELPEEFRTAIILVDIEELSYDDAAKVLDCPIGTIRSRLSRGRRMLQLALKEYALKRGIIKK